eukprot:scaffold6.g2563.t1
MEHVLVRLNEDDVDYSELKVLCRQAGIPGGRDSKENLRARLIRHYRQELGMPVIGPETVDASKVKRGEDMVEFELVECIRAHHVLVPQSLREQVNLVNALLVADGLLQPSDLISTSTRSDADEWSRRTVAELKQECSKRRLSTKGLKSQLINKLMEWESNNADDRHDEHAEWHVDVSIGMVPPVVSPIDYTQAHNLLAALRSMTLEEMREELRRRGLPWSGKREVLVAQLTLAARKQIVQAMGGEARLARIASVAVDKLSDHKVKQQLAELAPAAVPPPVAGERASFRELREVLQRAVANKWMDEVMKLGPPPGEEHAGAEGGAEGAAAAGAAAGAAASSSSALLELERLAFGGDAAGEQYGLGEGGGYEAGGEAGGEEEAPPHEAFLFGPPDDPTLTLALVAGGPSARARDGALVAARLAVHYLQSDPFHGTMPAHQLARGGGAERQAVAVDVYYARGAAAGQGQQLEQQQEQGGLGEAAGRLVRLSWEQLFGATAAELDASLGAAPAAGASLADVAASADAVLPLGLPPVAAAAAAGAGAGADRVLGSLSAAALANDCVALAGRLSALGYPTAPVRRLELAACQEAAGVLARGGALEDSAAHGGVTSWMAAAGLDAALGRVAVRAERGGAVLGAAVAQGADEALVAGLALMDAHGVESVVLEAMVPGATHVTVTVLGGPEGPVALPPSELSYYDLEEDIAAVELRWERFLAVREGWDEQGVDSLLSILHREATTHPGYVGGQPATPTQQLRHSLPPAGLPAEVSESVRLAAVKAFNDLGLRDYAQFTAWVLPAQREPSEMEAALAAFAASSLDPSAAVGDDGAAASSGEQGPPLASGAPLRTFSELQALAADDGGGGGGGAVSAADRAGAVDVEVAAPGPSGRGIVSGSSGSSSSGSGTSSITSPGRRAELAVFGEDSAVPGPWARGREPEVVYGKFRGVEIDDSTRMDWLAAHPPDPASIRRPAEEDYAPRVVVEALPDPSAASPVELCSLAQHTVAFCRLSLTPDLGDPTSKLLQQAAAVGLSHESLLRELVSLAAARGGGPPLPRLPRAAAPAPAPDLDPELEEVREVQQFDPAAAVAWLGSDDDDLEALFARGGDESTDGAPEEGAEANGVAARGAADAASQGQQQEAAASAAQAVALMAEEPSPPGWELPAGWEAADADGAAAPAGGADALADEWAGEEDTVPLLSKQPVWVLMGGEGPERQVSLAGGLHAFLSLKGDSMLEPEAFLLEPPRCGRAEEARRRELLDRRLDLMKLGADDETLLEEFSHLHLTRIRNPPASGLWRSVWRLTRSWVLRGSVEDLQAACEAALATATSSASDRAEAGADIPALLVSAAQQETELAGLEGEGSAWGGAPPDGLGPPQALLLQDFVAEAFSTGAVVLLALGRESLAAGPLQAQLEAAGVPCTSSASVATELCAERAALVEQLRDLEPNGISCPPQHKISLPELAAQCGDEAGADRLFAQLCAHLGAAASLCVRPAAGAPGRGLMEAGCGADLAAYAAAVEGWWGEIPGALLSEGQAVAMDFPPPTHLVIEPVIHTDPLLLCRAADGSLRPPPGGGGGGGGAAGLGAWVHWEGGAGRWLEVTAHLLGEAGAMRCLGPSATVYEVQEEGGGEGPAAAALAAVAVELEGRAEAAAELLRAAGAGGGEQQQPAVAEEAQQQQGQERQGGQQEQEQGGEEDEEQQGQGQGPGELLLSAFQMTPPPLGVARPEAVLSARTRLMLVADRLGISGAARVDALMHAETGELVVMDVSTAPDLSAGALIFRQGAAEDPPLAPAEIFRELIRVSVSRAPEPDLLPADMQALAYGSGDALAEADDLGYGGDAPEPPAWTAGAPLEFEDLGYGSGEYSARS